MGSRHLMAKMPINIRSKKWARRTLLLNECHLFETPELVIIDKKFLSEASGTVD
jgi:hypothetical protein